MDWVVEAEPELEMFEEEAVETGVAEVSGTDKLASEPATTFVLTLSVGKELESLITEEMLETFMPTTKRVNKQKGL